MAVLATLCADESEIAAAMSESKRGKRAYFFRAKLLRLEAGRWARARACRVAGRHRQASSATAVGWCCVRATVFSKRKEKRKIQKQKRAKRALRPLRRLSARARVAEMRVSAEAMRAAKVPLPFRDFCAHLLVPLNQCREQTYYLPWKCHAERHAYEKCEHEELRCRRARHSLVLRCRESN